MIDKITTKHGRIYFAIISFFSVFFLWGLYVMVSARAIPYSLGQEEGNQASGCSTDDPFITKANCR